MKTLFWIFCLLSFQATSKSNELNLLGGLYWNHTEEASLVIGGAYIIDSPTSEKLAEGELSQYLYADIEVGKNNKLATFGRGYKGLFGGSFRYGASIGRLDDSNVIGLVTTASILTMSAKIGIYSSSENQSKLILGVGFQF
ncbi:hypothetical protein [Psychrosphaera algicola]|uniref:Outer membrane protein beta-barrel domain-containing protein n=1 Tax=Psychrosphaera algicola TaxID=3023714 RepID=A0ABT5F9L3_9GAMM|nr:hypothetical protein [Psychrosphaera sp. G1-22]MDC2887657.1 hypothetical protein [Psychrosphaera sp. G1-22]